MLIARNSLPMFIIDPAKRETMEYIRAGLGIPVVSTYGRTETSGIATSRNIFDYSETPHAGGPVGCNEIKLLNDAEEGYASVDDFCPRGEVRAIDPEQIVRKCHKDQFVPTNLQSIQHHQILIRGLNIMKGYYRDPKATQVVLDKDGWFHTGDLGSFYPNGTLEILGGRGRQPCSSQAHTS